MIKDLKDFLYGYLRSTEMSVAIVTIVAVLVFIYIGLPQITSYVLGQQQKYRQTDPQDISTRQQIDRDLQNQIWLLDRQIQADTTLLSAGQTADTIQLEHKYEDLGYSIFMLYRRQAGDVGSLCPYCYPITDSSFVIDGKNSNDSSTVQWMTIHKGE